MSSLEVLAQQAAALAEGRPVPQDRQADDVHAAEAEVSRVMQVCNACRYCEGYCAVFPAMTRRLAFGPAEAHYLANLCHNCGACLHACQYADPHDFQINLPRTLARVRRHSYERFAWPAPLGRLYRRQGLWLSLAVAAAMAVVVALVVVLGGGSGSASAASGADDARGFYRWMPHGAMVALFGPVFAWAVLALGMGVRGFWRATPGGPDAGLDADHGAGAGANTGSGGVATAARARPAAAAISGPALGEAVQDALRLRYLDGGHGQGCHEADDGFTLQRRRQHHLVFYGFALCLASTTVATLMHYGLGLQAPYPWWSLPKWLGVPGGVMLVAGCIGLWRLRRSRHPAHTAAEQRPMDLGFIALLGWTAASGLMLMLAGLTSGPGGASLAIGLWLCLHLGAVLALFATAPYGKFAHGVYRAAAILKWQVERRQPNAAGVGE